MSTLQTTNFSVSVTTSNTQLSATNLFGRVTLSAPKANTDWITVKDSADVIVCEIYAQNIIEIGNFNIDDLYAVADSGTQTLIVNVQ